MAQVCKVGEKAENFTRYLTNSLEPWLLILDNADDPLLDISKFFPVGNRGTIIVTSRNPDCRCHATAGSKELREMERDEAITLLLRSGDLSSKDEDLRRLARPIVENLGYLALAVNHAGAFIRQRKCSLGDYLGIYTRHRKELLGSRPVQAGSDYEHTVYTTWGISVDSIKDLASETGSAAAKALDLLTFFGFCHFDDITERMFKSAWDNFWLTEEHPWWISNLLGMIQDRQLSEWDSLVFNKAVQLLSSYSLIHVSGSDNRISLHPLVHSWIRDSLSEEIHLRWWNTTVSTLALALASNFNNFQLERQLRVHLHHCIGIGQVDDLFREDDVPVDRVKIVSHIIGVYSYYPRKDALTLSERALEYSSIMLGDECYSTCLILCQFAQVLNSVFEYESVLDLLQGKVDVSIRVVGPGANVTLDIMRELVWAYRKLDRKQEALELAEQKLAICEESLDERDVRYLVALDDIAKVYLDFDRNEEAVDLLEKVVAKKKDVFGDEGLGVLDSEKWLAMAYSSSGQDLLALEMFQNVLDKSSKAWGEDHILTLGLMVHFAIQYGNLGEPEKGIPLIFKALETGSRVGIEESDLEGRKEILKCLQSESARLQTQRANAPTTLPERLPNSRQQLHSEGEVTSSRRKWRFWPKIRRAIDGPSS